MMTTLFLWLIDFCQDITDLLWENLHTTMLFGLLLYGLSQEI